MTSFAKILALAVLVAAGAASAQAGALVSGCQEGTITPHGVWDCR